MSEPMDIENDNEIEDSNKIEVEGSSLDQNKNNPNKILSHGEGISGGEPHVETNEKKPKKKRFEIKRWTAVAFWSWDQTNERCAICRNHLMEPCIECTNKIDSNSMGEKVNCPRAVGRCNHSFHLHCISTWIKTRNSCPLDSTEWALKEVVNN